MTNPGLGSFVFSGCKELITVLGNFQLFGIISVITLFWSLAFGNNFVI